MKFARTITTGLALLAAPLTPMALAQDGSTPADTIVVFDGSGSMWGQIQGRSKIEIARDTLSSVLTEVPRDAKVGMIAYGHRQKGVCSDIETVVAPGPAGTTVPAMIAAAGRITPKGKTPLSDAVRLAARELRYTENAATVILVTDGIETCNADPCALANELERAGIDFTAHVVGFGLSREEGRQVACLAENTGGLYISADNADELGDALRQTVVARPVEADEDDFGPAEPAARRVRFVFRDTQGGPQIGIRELEGLVERADGTPVAPDAFALAYPEASGNSATGTLEPGSYVALLRRTGREGSGYGARFPFEVPAGEGEHTVEGILSGALTLNVFINPALPYRKGDPFPTAVGGSRPRVNFAIHAIENGQKSAEPVATITGVDNLTRPLPPGRYLIQGNLDSGTSAQKVVEVSAGEPTVVDFSFDATRVFVDAREADGLPVRRETSFWYDRLRSGRNFWVRGRSAQQGGPQPFYLPTGRWLLNTGGEGYGKRRSERIVTVPGDYRDMTVRVGESETLSQSDRTFLETRGTGCLEILKVRYSGCLVARADLSDGSGTTTKAETELQPVTVPAGQGGQGGHGGATADNLAGLSGETLAFAARDGGAKAWIVFDPAFGEEAVLVLQTGWCGTGDCAGRRVRVPTARIERLRGGEGRRLEQIALDDFELEYRFFGADKITLYIKPNGQERIRFDLTDKMQSSGDGDAKRAELQPEPQPQPAPQPSRESAGPALLEGLSGTAYAFVDATGAVKAHIVFAPGDTRNATVVLSEAWCGLPACKADRFTVAYDKVDHLLEEGFTAARAGGGGYTLDVSSFGTDKEIAVSGAGASRVRMTLMDRIELSAATPSGGSGTRQASIDDGSEAPIGVFSLDQSGATVATIAGDPLHVNKCQRRQTVFWPDGTVAVRRFQEPRPGDTNPYRIVASGRCVRESAQHRCTLQEKGSNRAETMAFTARALGDNHYELREAGRAQPTLAASCFFPGGDMRPAQVMPNGRTLAQMMLEREDGRVPGMAYDAAGVLRRVR